MRPFKGLFALILLLPFMPARAEEPLLLGVLEDPQCYRDIQCDYGRDKACVEAMERKVRPLFARSGDDWIALDTRSVAERFDLRDPPWTIAFDGRDLGAVRTVATEFNSNYEWTYSRDFVLELRAGQALPEIANKDGGFVGWCEIPAHRPLVLVTGPNYRDPERWKPFRPADSYRNMILDGVRNVMASSLCVGGKDGAPVDVPISSEQLEEITAANLKLKKSYRAGDGRELISVELDTRYTEICYIEEYPYLGSLTFLKQSDTVQFIGGELQLVDAGDYDNDGRSEVLFWHGGYNRDGYVFLYDDFRRRVEYLWGYH